jgi:septal ring factor EnvC (AmiA/AmiB activator)
MGIEAWAALVAAAGVVLGGALGIARWVARDEVSKAQAEIDAEIEKGERTRQELAERVTRLEAQRAEDVRRLDEIKDDLKGLRNGLEELLRRVK